MKTIYLHKEEMINESTTLANGLQKHNFTILKEPIVENGIHTTITFTINDLKTLIYEAVNDALKNQSKQQTITTNKQK